MSSVPSSVFNKCLGNANEACDDYSDFDYKRKECWLYKMGYSIKDINAMDERQRWGAMTKGFGWQLNFKDHLIPLYELGVSAEDLLKGRPYRKPGFGDKLLAEVKKAKEDAELGKQTDADAKDKEPADDAAPPSGDASSSGTVAPETPAPAAPAPAQHAAASVPMQDGTTVFTLVTDDDLATPAVAAALKAVATAAAAAADAPSKALAPATEKATAPVKIKTEAAEPEAPATTPPAHTKKRGASGAAGERAARAVKKQ